MRLGLNLLNAGETSTYSALSRIAQTAEALGYDSLWVTEQEPFPLTAPTQHPIFTGELIVSRKPIDCTLEALAVAAVQTDRIRLGISLPNVPFYSPIAVGESLAGLDVLSDGRVQVGLGLGWSAAEFQTVAAALARPQTPANEFVRALRTVWNGCETAFSGEYFAVPREPNCVTPIQRPSPPIVLTAFAPAAVQPPAVLLRGGAPLSAEIAEAEMVRALQTVGPRGPRHPDAFEVVVRAVVRLTDASLGNGRPLFAGTLAQVADDIAIAYAQGAAELTFDLSQMAADLSVEQHIGLVGQLSDLVPASMRTPAAPAPIFVAA